MSNDHYDDVDHLIRELKLDGVHYRDFSERRDVPRLKLVATRPADPAPALAEAPTPAPAAITSVPEARETATPQPEPAPTEALQAVFSRLLARAPAPPVRKIGLDLRLPAREAAEEAPQTSGAASLKQVFARLNRHGGDSIRKPGSTG